jgi:hypothetical protein
VSVHFNRGADNGFAQVSLPLCPLVLCAKVSPSSASLLMRQNLTCLQHVLKLKESSGIGRGSLHYSLTGPVAGPAVLFDLESRMIAAL